MKKPTLIALIIATATTGAVAQKVLVVGQMPQPSMGELNRAIRRVGRFHEKVAELNEKVANVHSDIFGTTTPYATIAGTAYLEALAKMKAAMEKMRSDMWAAQEAHAQMGQPEVVEKSTVEEEVE